MNTLLFLCIPVGCMILYFKYNLENRKLQGSGRIPDIQASGNRKAFFLAMSILTLLIGVIFLLNQHTDKF